MEIAMEDALKKAQAQDEAKKQAQEKAREQAQEEAKKKNEFKAGFSDQDAEALVKTAMGEDVFKREKEGLQNISNKSMADKTNQEFPKKPENIKKTEIQKDLHPYGGAVGHQVKELSSKLKTAELIDKKGTREQIEENKGRVEFFKNELDRARQAGEAEKEMARKRVEKAIEEKKKVVDNQAKAGEEKVKESGGEPSDVEAAQKSGEELKDEVKSSAEKAEEAIKAPEFKEEDKTGGLEASSEGTGQTKKEMEGAVSQEAKEAEGQTEKGEEKVESAGEMAEDVKDAQKAGEELRDKTISSEEKAKEVVEEKKPKTPEEIKTPEELLKDIGGKRSAYIDAEKKLNEARKSNAEGLAVFLYDHEKAKLEYENSRARYAHDMYKNELALLKDSGLSENDPQYKARLDTLVDNLHRDVLVNEQQRLMDVKSENLTPLKRTWFRSTLEKFGKMPRWQRVLISTGLVTGAAVAGGGLGLAAAAAFGGGRFARGMLFGALAGKSAGLVKTIGGGKIEEWLRQQDQNLRTQFEVDLRSDIAVNDFEMFRDNLNRRFTERNKILQEVNRRHRNINLLAAGTAVLIGGTAALSLSGSGVSSLFEQKGAGISGKDIFGGGGKTTSFGFPATTDHTLGVKMGPPYDIKEALSAAKLNEIVVGKGDNLWNIIDKKLENIYGIKYEGLGEARQTYIIDSIKDEIARNPGAYGLKNIDQLQPGQKIDLSGVIADHKMTHVFDNAKHLTDAQLKNIGSHLAEQAPGVPGEAPIFVPDDAAERMEGVSGVGETIELAPGNKMHAIASKLYLGEQRGLEKVISSLGGEDKFLDMPASSLFYQEGTELDVFREKLGLQLKQLTNDSYKLHDNVTSIRKVLESIDASKLPEAVEGAEKSINMTEGTVEKL